MTPYILLATILAASCLVESRIVSLGNEKILKLLKVFIPVGLFSFAVLRSSTLGNDYARYNQYYEYVVNGHSIDWIQWLPGMKWVYEFFATIGLSYALMIFIISAIVFGTQIYLITRISSRPLMSLYIYVCLFIFSGQFVTLRQSVAMTFAFAVIHILLRLLKLWDGNEKSKARDFLTENRIYILALGLLFLAGLTFHISIIVLPLIVIGGLLIQTPRKLFILLVTALVISIVLMSLKSIIIHVFGYDNVDYQLMGLQFNTPAILISAGAAAMSFWLTSYDRAAYSTPARFLLSVFGVGLIVNVCFAWVPNLYRFNEYFNLIYVVSLPLLVRSIEGRINLSYFKKGMITALFIAALWVFFMYQLMIDSLGIVPFRTI